jgi:hypothetical protein
VGGKKWERGLREIFASDIDGLRGGIDTGRGKDREVHYSCFAGIFLPDRKKKKGAARG